MYSTLSANHEVIVNAISAPYVADYERLLANVGQAGGVSYQQEYRTFWVMNVARLSDTFYSVYFGQMTLSVQPPPLVDLCHTLHAASARSNGKKSLQFSFATKLLHMFNPTLPIYDSRVARFYLFQELASDRPLNERVDHLVKFYDFLSTEYSRMIASGKLASAIAAFRKRFNPSRHTDQKIVDWLIWRFVGLADEGALLKRKTAYV